jgi:hypothetical protein
MDITTIAMLLAGAGLMVGPRLFSLAYRASQPTESDILADLNVVARIGRRMQEDGNTEAVKAANALIESVLRVPVERVPTRVTM